MKKIPRWFKIALFFLTILFLFFFPLPLYLEVPGTVFSLNDMVEVDKKYGDSTLDLYMTTVGIKQVTPIKILGKFLPYQDLVSESELVGNFDDVDSYNTIQKYYMNHSINNAIRVAFDTADRDYQLEYKGVYVLQVLEESDFFDKLKVGDIVESIDNKKFENSEEFIEYIKGKKTGEELHLKVTRDKEKLIFSGELVELESGENGIGIALTDNSSIETDPRVEIHSKKIGGPSAGLMFSLEIYEQLMEESLQGDYKIAGTGTMSPDGKVGRVGGVEKKVVAADKEKVDYFFVPNDEISDEFREINPEIKSNYDAAVKTANNIQ
ncbi:MAG: PDZ domain-containing protein, partial [Atopostipes sp.]|nr:PDZ domain-containing protein [Atopostipes sp.]